MKHSKATGSGSSDKWTKREAFEILCECKMLRWTVAALEEKALEVLKRPELRVIDGSKRDGLCTEGGGIAKVQNRMDGRPSDEDSGA